MNKIIANLLRKCASDLENGTSHLSSQGCYKALNTINLLMNGDEEMSKKEASEYIGVSRATFENYVRDNIIPEGKHHEGTKALFWFKSDLDNYLYNN